MSDKTKQSAKKPDLHELRDELRKLQRVREGMVGNLAKAKDDAAEERKAKIQEMDSARARALKPFKETKAKALEAANAELKARQAKIQQDYEEELKPIEQRREALLKEAKADHTSKCDSAHLAFNKEDEDLREEWKKELKEIEAKHQERLASYDRQYQDQVREVEGKLAEMKVALEQLEAARKPKAEEAQATA